MLTLDQQNESAQAVAEQDRLDMDISILRELCDRNGVQAVTDWLASIEILIQREAERKYSEFLCWNESNSYDLAADSYDEF